MAERTKFAAYCVYSGVISLLIYPIEAHWIWGGGWLSRLGFHDYAGSCAIHMVGGIAALIGAAVLGPRIGKYVRDKAGRVTKFNAIPGHSIPLGALGVFILWLGWYGFNGAAATTPSELSAIFLTTTIAPSVATCTTMLYTWIKNGKPDVSMCLNASLAGLVGITAGCDALDALGATVVGIVSGLLVVVVVEQLDLRLHIDDPVGAVGVHCANGIVDVELQVQRLDHDDHQNARDEANDGGAYRVKGVAARRNCHQTGEGGVEAHGNVRLAVLYPGVEQRGAGGH